MRTVEDDYRECDPLGLDGYGNEPIPAHPAPLRSGPLERIEHGSCVVTLAENGRYLVRRASSSYEVLIVNGALMRVDWLKPGSGPIRVASHGRTIPEHLGEVVRAADAFANARRWRPGCGW